MPNFSQTLGYTQEARRHLRCQSSSVQTMCHMLAVAPPMSLTTPVQPGTSFRPSISRSTDASLRETTSRPWCSVMQQKLQPAAQPRMIGDAEADLLHAGIFAAPYIGCGRRVNGSSYSPSINSVEGGGAGGFR